MVIWKTHRNYVEILYCGAKNNLYSDCVPWYLIAIPHSTFVPRIVYEFCTANRAVILYSIRWGGKYAKRRVRGQGLTATQSSRRQHLRRLQTISIKSKARQVNRDVQSITSEYHKVLQKCANHKSTSVQHQQQEKQAGENNEDELLLMMSHDGKTWLKWNENSFEEPARRSFKSLMILIQIQCKEKHHIAFQTSWGCSMQRRHTGREMKTDWTKSEPNRGKLSESRKINECQLKSRSGKSLIPKLHEPKPTDFWNLEEALGLYLYLQFVFLFVFLHKYLKSKSGKSEI